MLCNCAITFRLPSTRFETPEATGGSGGLLWDLAASNNTEVVLTDDFTVTAPNTTRPAIRSTNAGALNVGLSVVDRLELKLKNFDTVSAKFQLLGPAKSKAKTGDLSLALYASGSISNTESTSGAYTYSLSNHRYDGMAILGYRLSDTLLAYGGVFRAFADFDGSRTLSGSAGVPFAGTGANNGASIGFEVGNQKVRFIAEGSLNLVKSGESSRRFFNGGFAMEYHGF